MLPVSVPAKKRHTVGVIGKIWNWWGKGTDQLPFC